ncbi:putative toll-like receptor, P-loop containing nucleoside triphosphate hydrolase [Rosa chinensis]|uniref:Putative toll-like receptor, P-loop containing nucleoside triphosphate hydrolase n=2 Tax=Rosa chinensis TaxID=74649 RepID=A0A2P6QMM1_ROSCH|nr:putative toll-like receptor, P-loop containing nucleoside triphosphate hydrolase [Rosa chinensis]
MSSSNFEAFESTRKAMNELMEALEDDEVAAIGVYGMGGVGKTTMVKHFGAQAQKMGLFDRVIMAVVSQAPDIRNIQGTLADLLGLKLVEESESGRADRLQTEMLRRNKILIILDDIWNTLDLSSIGIPSYNELQICNSKLLFTTRRSNICHTMESQAKIHLNILSEDDAWNLFLKKARRSFQKSSPFYEVARKVAKECAGLPVALIAVARALGDKELEDWKEAARQLEMSQPANLDEEKDWSMDADEGYSAISLIESNIYKLPSKLVCSKLQNLLLQKNADIREIPRTFSQSLNDLRVLDLSHTGISSLPPSFSLLTRLESLCLDDCKSMIDISLLGKLKELKILSMRRCYSIKKFPKEIGNLTNLRILDLTETCFETVPSHVISRLYRLEELYMSYFGKWGSKVEGGFLSFKMKNASFDELIGLSSLNTLQVAICGAECLPQNVEVNPNWDRFYIIIQRYGTMRVPTGGNWGIYDEGFPNRCSRTLIMDETMNNLPDWFISVVTEKTEDLWYTGRHGNLLEEHDRGRLHGLKYLRIGSSEYAKAKVLFNTITWTRVSNEPVFENLKELVISRNLLKELCVGELPPGSLRNLERLMVDDCVSLVKPLLSSKLLHRLQSLKNLACSAFSRMKYVFGFEGHEPQHLVLTWRLRMISLRNMHGLINIWDGLAPSGIFQSLKIFSLVDCPKLEYLFTSDVARCLLQLEELRVECCCSLDRIIEASEETESNKIVLPQLKNLVLERLPELIRLSSTSSSTIDIEIEWPSLEHLHVSDCPQFSISASEFNSINQVQLNDYRPMGTLWIDSKARRSHFPKYMSPGRRERTQTELKAMVAHRSNRERIEPTIFRETAASLPSSLESSSSARRWKYDVFLSFRGPDTRKGITSDLYHRLQGRGIKTFMDDRDLEVGDAVSPTLLKTIEESRFAIVVLSRDYASSTWCLEELAKICEWMEDQSRILPLFYDVEPSVVRYQKKSFEEAFSKHETSGRHKSEKVKQWRDALNKVATFSGWNTQDFKTVRELVESIVELLSSKVVPDAIESTGDFEAFEATRQAMDDVMKALKDDQITAVGVYGMGGVGKTSMVRHVAAQACKNGTFNHWIMAAISQSPDLRKIQVTLADLLGFRFEEETEGGRADRLHKEVMRREKLLIILDDVQDRPELSSIGIPSYKQLKTCKSKVVLTTRGSHVCYVMNCQASIRLSILSEQDSWTLFVRNAGVAKKKILESTTFEDVARRVAGQCRGLPIALTAVARALRDKDEAEWQKAAQRLEKSLSETVKAEENAFECIKFSFDYLKDEHSKSCFLLCCLYPEGHDIPVENLFKDAIAKGLFRDAETIEEARVTADSVVKDLKDSSLLLDSEKNGCVKMHDVIWDTALNIAKSEYGFLVTTTEIEPTICRETAASLPSSLESSSSARRWKSDVFLSFRGADTRKGITSDLYKRLQGRGIKTFMDDSDLQVGDVISPALLKAIEESRFAIIVLSQKYASSTWCLEELTKICECMEDNNRILPLFYGVEPSDVRYRNRSFGEAFDKHLSSGRQTADKLQRWNDALNKVASFSGWNSQNYKTERELVDEIVEFLGSKVLPPDAIESTGDFEEYEATGQAMDKVMEALTEDEVTAVGVYGMGGVGKTIMVKHVAAQACKNGTFNHWIMVAITQSPNVRKIQGTLADLWGVKLEEETEGGRANSLRKEIMRRVRLLIILDDVWKRMELSKIGIPSYKELQKCKSKVLLTTRRLNVCDAMRCQRKITLSTLSEEDSWNLFVRNAMSFESTNFENVARKVARECAGLPIAVIEVARALKDKELAEWEEAAQRLENSQIADIDDGGFKCIKLSYDYLKDEDTKSCFLLCCLFPEDYDIPIGDLFKYAIGKGLFRDADTIQEARVIADSVVRYLKDSSLLLDSEKKGCVRMHAVIRDTALNIAKSEGRHSFLVKAGCGLKSWPCQVHEGYSAISLMNNDIQKLPGALICPKLQILLLQQNAELNEIPETFCQSPSELRVLDLSLTSIAVLPQSFSLLMNLQALYLDFCQKLIDFSVLGKLMKLEILSMRGSVLKELSREIGNLINLRMLDITDGIIGKIPSKVISQLHGLEELYLPFQFGDWVSKVEGEGEETDIGFGEVTGLSRLSILKVSISAKCIPEELEFYPNWLSFDICISGDTSSRDIMSDISNQSSQYSDKVSRSLSLDTRINALPAWFVDEVTVKTEKLLYVKCKWLNNILVEYHHGRLHMLKHLSIIGHSESLEELMNAITWVPVKPVFENLEELHLESVTSLKELCVGKLPPGSLYNLKLLKVRCCPNLGNILLPSKLLQRLPNLENIICKDMSRLEHVFGCQGFEPEQSKLREMTFINLPALRNICNGLAPRAMFQALKSLFIYHCTFLRCLFSFDTAQFLFQLEDLFVDSCPLLERLIEVRKEKENKKIILPKLKNLVLEKLPMLYSGSATINIKCPSLEHLNVKECPQFTASASDFQSKNQVLLNDKLHNFSLLGRRTERQLEAVAESVSSTIQPIATEFTMSMGDFQAFESRRLAMNDVMKALTDDEITAIGVYGKGGVGKTTMVEHVSEEVKNNWMFHHVITAVVSKSPDLRKIQGTLADMLGCIFEEETEIGRSRRLMQRIRRGNRILIILEDIWERINLSNVGIPSYHELQRCNSKVLITTRRENVCHAMKCQSNIFLDVLSEEDSWTLFVNRARMPFELTNFHDVARKVAKECAGLPVALIPVAKALRDKCLDDWKEAAGRLKASQPANHEDGEVVFNCIKLSYDYLTSDDAQLCFLLCCLFPEDYDIQIEDLLKYGMGKGLFQDSSTMQDARASAHSVVKSLRDCGLLLESERDGCVKMHDVIRDAALRISSSGDGPLFFVQAGCQLKEWPSSSPQKGCSAISLIRNKICKLPKRFVCSKLLILFMQSNVYLDEVPDCFFENLKELRVLDLSRTRISLLPTSFDDLINLHTLYLDGCLSIINNISILGKLKKLKILSMRELPLVEMPKEIGDLSHLRMLDVTGDYVDNVPSEVICNLNLLEELYMQCNFADWGSKVEGAGEENIAAFDEITGLSNLNVLKVFISDAKCLPEDVEVEPNWLNFDICISRDPSIRKVSLVSSSSPAFTRALTLDTTINALPGWFINVVTMKAEKLKYILCWGLDNILVEYDCGRLHELKYLSVIRPNANLKVLMNTVTRFRNEPVLQNLEELHLIQVHCLKELCVGELPPGSLCNLRLLKVKHCYELVDALLPSGLLQRLQNLDKVICEEMDELEYVFGCEGLKPEQMILTQLKEMRLENLRRLIKIWNGLAPCAIFQNLQSLVVSGCYKLKNLFSADVAQCLLHLKDISVELCPILDNVIEASKETVDNQIVFPKLKNLALIKLPQLTRFCGGTGCVIKCPLLEYLYVDRCPRFPTFDFHSRNEVQRNHPQHLDIVQRRETEKAEKMNGRRNNREME